ncbi:MAG: putative peptidoglycan lipid flippase, partial [Blastocatellia bacterium]|nr:putative peptidoglycan lipid flippase [Blastocatellia bacterium]
MTDRGAGSNSKVPDSNSKDDRPTPPDKLKPGDLDSRSSASEIAGETVDVVGAATGTFPPAETEQSERESTAKGAFMVGAGILISRIIGVIRQRVFAYYLGTSDAAGAFNAAFRIPNFLQNVFGEGALSASFIPV